LSFRFSVCVFAFSFCAKTATYFYSDITGQEQNEVIGMETKFREKLRGNGLYGLVKDLKAAYQKVPKLSVKASGATVAASAPYETSKAHKTLMLEFECNRAQAVAEANRQTFRGQ
jgi:hypothetical protein